MGPPGSKERLHTCAEQDFGRSGHSGAVNALDRSQEDL